MLHQSLRYIAAMAALGAAFLMVVAAASAAVSPRRCDARDRVLTYLEREYDERPAVIGIARNGALIEVFVSPGGATWSLIVSHPNGNSCLVSAGVDWRQLPPQVPGEGT